MFPHPQATSTDYGGLRTSVLSIEKRRRNHLTTSLQKKIGSYSGFSDELINRIFRRAYIPCCVLFSIVFFIVSLIVKNNNHVVLFLKINSNIQK